MIIIYHFCNVYMGLMKKIKWQEKRMAGAQSPWPSNDAGRRARVEKSTFGQFPVGIFRFETERARAHTHTQIHIRRPGQKFMINSTIQRQTKLEKKIKNEQTYEQNPVGPDRGNGSMQL